LVDGERIGLIGGSRGGALALAAVALVPNVTAMAPSVPFLSDFSRASVITDAYPFKEIGDYLAIHRHKVELVQTTLL
jgi:cephalosporin-C deacetylase